MISTLKKRNSTYVWYKMHVKLFSMPSSWVYFTRSVSAIGGAHAFNTVLLISSPHFMVQFLLVLNENVSSSSLDCQTWWWMIIQSWMRSEFKKFSFSSLILDYASLRLVKISPLNNSSISLLGHPNLMCSLRNRFPFRSVDLDFSKQLNDLLCAVFFWPLILLW